MVLVCSRPALQKDMFPSFVLDHVSRECLTQTLCTDLQVSWFCGRRELAPSEILQMSHDGDRYQLEITSVLPTHEGEYSCMATNSAGMVTCSATLNLDGE